MDVVKTAQNISYSPGLTTPLSYRENSIIPLTALSSSGLPVSYNLISGPSTLAGATLSVSQTGIVVVDAEQTGDNAYNPATTLRQSIVIAPGEVTL